MLSTAVIDPLLARNIPKKKTHFPFLSEVAIASIFCGGVETSVHETVFQCIAQICIRIVLETKSLQEAVPGQ